MTSTEIARAEGNSLADRMKYAQALASASLLPRAYQANPGNVLLAMELGDALGIRPIQAINAIHVIEGKPSASADLIASLIRKAGHRLRVKGDDQSATAQLIRADDPTYTFEATWTIERAKAAGLSSKAVWKSYPAAMLKARAITEVAREGASDALYGVIYTPEEIGADVDGTGDVVSRSNGNGSTRRGGMAGLRDAVAPAADVVDADIVDDPEPQTLTADEPIPEDDPTPATRKKPVEDVPLPAEPAPGGITRAQSTKIHALLGEQGMSERTIGLACLSDILGRDVESSKTLTVAEAHKVIETLEFDNDPQEPPLEDR